LAIGVKSIDRNSVKQESHLFPLTSIYDFFQFLRYHYAVLAVLPLSAGILASRTIIPAICILLAFLLVVRKKILGKKALFWLLTLPIGFLLGLFAEKGPETSGFAPYFGQKGLDVRGVVVSEPYLRKGYHIADVAVVSIDANRVDGKMRVKFNADSRLGHPRHRSHRQLLRGYLRLSQSL